MADGPIFSINLPKTMPQHEWNIQTDQAIQAKAQARARRAPGDESGRARAAVIAGPSIESIQ